MADPPTARVGPFIDNLKERLKLAMKVQNTIREMDPDAMRKLDDLAGGQDFNNYRLDLMQLSVFLFTDIDHIWLPGVSADIRGDRLFESLQASENLLAICWVPISKIKPAGTYANSYPVLQRKDSNQKVRKDQSERNKAFVRDNEQCLFSNVPEAEVAHIWPYTVTDRVDSHYNTRDP